MDHEDARRLLKNAIQSEKEGDFVGAKLAYMNAHVKARKGEPELGYLCLAYLGRLERDTGNEQSGQDFLMNVINNQSVDEVEWSNSFVIANLALARFFAEKGNFKPAIDGLEIMLAGLSVKAEEGRLDLPYPPIESTLSLLATCYHRVGRLDDACHAYENISKALRLYDNLFFDV